MNDFRHRHSGSDPLAFLADGGEMGRLIRSKDWSRTPLGPLESWPQSLRTTVSLCLASKFPSSMVWGPKHVQIYNDNYWPICGGKHPRSLGQDFTECWASAMPVIGEAFSSALAGPAQFLENQRMFLDRHGYLEETFFTFSFSPIRDETGRVGGLFHPVTETTPHMLAQRRTKALRDLAARTGTARSVDDALAVAVDVLAEFPFDLPFLLFYRVAEDGQEARLLAGAHLERGAPGAPTRIRPGDAPEASPWGEVLRTRVAVQVDDVRRRVGQSPGGPYPEPPKSAWLLPILPPGAGGPVAVLVIGVSPRLPFDEDYRNFLDLLAASTTAAVAIPRASEERRRAESLAELDRAKTALLPDVSHEFRTPHTLILGPRHDALAEAKEPAQRDFSRIDTACQRAPWM